MTKIKMCGLTRPEDISAANELKPELIGFVFAKKSKRYVTPSQAAGMRAALDRKIKAVGVFVDEAPETVAELLNGGVIDIAQLHGHEDENYISRLRELTDKPLIKAFRITGEKDTEATEKSSADLVLLDAGAGDGITFDWSLIKSVQRPYFLAGGLHPQNAGKAVRELRPYALDVSSGIETDGHKDRDKMAEFIAAVRKEDQK